MAEALPEYDNALAGSYSTGAIQTYDNNGVPVPNAPLPTGGVIATLQIPIGGVVQLCPPGATKRRIWVRNLGIPVVYIQMDAQFNERGAVRLGAPIRGTAPLQSIHLEPGKADEFETALAVYAVCRNIGTIPGLIGVIT